MRLRERVPSGSTGLVSHLLASHGDRPALVTTGETVTFPALAARVAEQAARLGSTRRLVALTAANDVDSVVAYLAALDGGQPVLLLGAAGDGGDAVVSRYDPDVVIGRSAAGTWTVDERRPGTRHDLHPDLAALLTTSGSTGSPKVVRLSRDNLWANAAAIATYLSIGPEDRAATTLPMHYCYGLSVMNSHLLRGASLLLTEASVVDPEFWTSFRSAGATSFAGVPYTFDLLDRCGFTDLELPALRYVTQAGGRLPPETVRRYARLGQRRGWQFFVMYGQTEATARMAYLPPQLAADRPEAVGVPVPGGAFEVRPVEDAPDGCGELVYTGPNVMMGYAEQPADLARGAELTALATGDLGRRAGDGLFEIVGRRSRLAKVYGVRVDLGHLEARLAADGLTAVCAQGERGITVVTETAPEDRVRAAVVDASGLPVHAVHVITVDLLPRLPSGKPDLPAIQVLVAAARRDDDAPQPSGVTGGVGALFAAVLNRDDVTADSTFVSLGGDSLSFVEASVALEERLGHLPDGWHTMTVAELDRAARPARRNRLRAIDSTVLLRAVAILLIVGSHADLYDLVGGAHLLIAVAGYNFGRFHLSAAPRLQRVRNITATAIRVAIPAIVWIAVLVLLAGQYTAANVLLLNEVLGPQRFGPSWEFWFLEVLVHTLLAVAILVAVPGWDRAERRRPFLVAAGALAVALTTRFGLIELWSGPHTVDSTPAVFWLFALGWLAAKSVTPAQRLLVTAAALACVPGFFGDPQRETIVVAGIVLLIWVRRCRVPRGVHALAALLAASSLYIYVSHWQVFPHLERHSPVLAVLASIAVGVAYRQLAAAVPRSRWWTAATSGASGLARRMTTSATPLRRAFAR